MHLLEMNVELRDGIAVLAVAILGLVVKWIAVKFNLNQAKADALQAVAIGVAAVNQTYVDEIKKARQDGVLTTEEKAEAKRRAIEKAIQVAGPAASAVIQAWSQEQADTMVEATVASAKG